MVSGSRYYYGWNIVAAATFLTLLTVGMRMGIGPFFLPMAQDLGLSRNQLSSIIAVGMLFYGLAMPVAGYLAGAYGTRITLTLGVTIVLASTVWTVLAQDAGSFFLAYGVLLSVGLGLTGPVALSPVLSRWFTRQRGMAMFFLSTGSMAGIAIMTPAFGFAVEAWEWRPTLLGFATLFAMTALPVAWLIIRDQAPEHTDLLPEQIAAGQSAQPASAAAPSMSVAAAMRTGPFWMVTAGLFVCGYSMNLLGTHGVPMLVDHGFDATTGAMGIGVIGLVAILGTLVLGRLADIVQRRYMLATIYFVRGLGFIALMIVSTQLELYAAATISGLVWAGSIALSSAILADVYGVRLMGVLYGWAYLGHQIGATISSWLGGWGFDTFATHWIAFGSAAFLLLVAALVSLRLPGPATPAISGIPRTA